MKKIKTFKRASKVQTSAASRHVRLFAIIAIEVFRPQARAKAKQHTMLLQLYEEPPSDKSFLPVNLSAQWLKSYVTIDDTDREGHLDEKNRSHHTPAKASRYH